VRSSGRRLPVSVSPVATHEVGWRSSQSGGGVGDGGRETFDSGRLHATRRTWWAREAQGHEREPTWWLSDGQGAAGRAIVGEFHWLWQFPHWRRKKKRSGTGALIAEGGGEELKAASLVCHHTTT
jgi:hypothetical protein